MEKADELRSEYGSEVYEGTDGSLVTNLEMVLRGHSV